MKYISFFSGALGLDLGLERAGFEPLLACEIDKFCIQTISKNRPKLPLINDIRNYSCSDIRTLSGIGINDTIDLVVGGPPCQAFSTAGARKSFEDERGNVFIKYLELATELNSKFIVIENVRGLLSAPLKHRPHNQRGNGFPPLSDNEKAGGALKFIISFLEGRGYGISFNLYNAANYGAPQIRERVVIIASRDGKKLPYLYPTHSDDPSWGLPSWRTFRQAVENMPEINHIECDEFPEKRLKYYRLIGPGGNWKSLPVEMQKEAMGGSYNSGGGKTGFLRRLAWDKPSPTLLTSPIMPATDLAHPVEDRPLSVAEYARIQEFPDDWFFAGKTKDKYKQIGNAVPSSLGFAIGNLLKNHVEGIDIPPPDGFKFSRYKYTSDIDWMKSLKN
ncbi:DNA cytosine methyltransferase [Aeromonas simiae]|uniref:DNA cytosine methyltransferase n=1 Tax=Aeromonas simiae TaxID=218936 RepID=UPI00266BE500|nr:DNA cytosine methyltransferase [Aeromonas simiae]MDO2949179.1 DNA cytosine methyltransferase [Aeromonas simiae]MDO2952696.1 DNA cytosine methyltransferase [Aeromonas simiae]MDO2956397.1 DNA cytosine methyltransferase [Aeromonas simiae]